MIPVIELIPTETAEQAISVLKAKLTAAGFDAYEGEPESEESER
jgi:hypothetical protein